MPSYAEALDDRQIAELAQYMRARFAPQEPPWTELPQKVRDARAGASIGR
jgi:nicotinate dehydrogenase subunit B